MREMRDCMDMKWKWKGGDEKGYGDDEMIRGYKDDLKR